MTDATTGGPDPSAYDALAQAKELLRSVRAGALATLVPGNAFPFASLVNVATAPDGSPILLLSRLAAHTRHLDADPRLSLLLVQTGAGDPLAHPRVTIMGTGECVIDPDGRAALKARFLARHPESALYADFADFSFWRVVMEQAHLNGGFARAGNFKAASIVTSLDGAEALVAAEPQALAEVNARHQDALARLAGRPNGPWQATGIDPEGIDLGCGDRTARIAFPRRVHSLRDLFDTLPALVAAAGRAATSGASDD
jgi:heme iron utilization protein